MRLLCILCCILSLAGGQAMAGGRQYGQIEAVVVRVCDGDTVVVDIPGYPDII